MKRIITISREFGSGGRTIGKEVARRLDYNFFDRELVEEVAKRSGFSQDFIEENGEYANARSSLLFYWATAKQHSMENLSMHDRGTGGDGELRHRRPLCGLYPARPQGLPARVYLRGYGQPCQAYR